jgi:hypothetical protein
MKVKVSFLVASAIALCLAQGAIADEVQPSTTVAPVPWLGDAPRAPLRSDVRAPEPMVLAAPASGLAVDTADREAVRVLYKGLYSQSDNVPINWTGTHSTCAAGTTDQLFQAAVALRINWFRAMAGIPAMVSLYGPYSVQNQQAALVMSTNNSLSHTPPSSWNCWSQIAYDAASSSNIAIGTNGAEAVTGYIKDNGSNNAPVGHRRWLLHPQTQNMGTGDVSAGTFNGASVSSANSIWVFDSHTFDTRPAVRDDFIAWPPKGYVPYPVVYGRWSLAHTGANFSNATVTVSKGGVVIPVSKEVITNGYGENTLVWLLQGTNDSTLWTRPTADEVYSVTVANAVLNGVARTFSYTVTVFDPDTPTPGAAQTVVLAPTSASANTAFAASVTPMARATGYQLALYRVASLSGTITPALTPNPWSYATGPTAAYNPVETNAFHLYHSAFASQSLTLNKKLLIGQNASVAFDSWFTFASSGQVAHVQISLDDGVSWQDIYTEVGSNNTPHTTRTLSLAAFAGRAVKLKFEFSYVMGQSAYYQASTGWFFNNINLSNVSELLDGQTATIAASQSSASFTAPAEGNYVLAARTEYQGSYFTDWGQVSTFRVGAATVPTTTVRTLQAGWNLWGNSAGATLSVATVFGNPAVVTSVWKWDAALKRWQFYAPSMDAASLQTTAAANGYGVLSAIAPGEGYWVNAKTTGNVTLSVGAPFVLKASNLVSGWNLVATADDVLPAAFNLSLSTSAVTPGTVPLNLTSLWAWDSSAARWLFYAPSLQGSAELASYLAGNGYLDFTQANKTLGNGTGFWVKKP